MTLAVHSANMFHCNLKPKYRINKPVSFTQILCTNLPTSKATELPITQPNMLIDASGRKEEMKFWYCPSPKAHNTEAEHFAN